jgi:hypothetical protein
LRGDRCDQHCVASQAVRGSEKMTPIAAERPANGGLLQFGIPSLCSRFPGIRVSFGESLWLIPRIFPFSRDCSRRPGFDLHCGVRLAGRSSGRLRKRKCPRTAHRLVFAITPRASANVTLRSRSRRGLSRIAIERWLNITDFLNRPEALSAAARTALKCDR